MFNRFKEKLKNWTKKVSKKTEEVIETPIKKKDKTEVKEIKSQIKFGVGKQKRSEEHTSELQSH